MAEAEAIPAPAVPASARVRWARLTGRQREICTRIALGESRYEICSALEFSLKTYDSHRRHSFARLGIRSIADLVRLAIAAGAIRVEVEP